MIQQFDVSVLLWIQENLRAEWMNDFWKVITFLGETGWFWIALGAILLCIPKTRPVGGMVLVSLAIGALITNVTLKNLVARIRPYDYTEAITALIGPQADFSFPSGHTCASFAAAFVCFRQLPARYGTAALILAGMIAFSRLYLGVHYPTDILGGVLVGLLSSLLACWGVEKIRQKRSE